MKRPREVKISGKTGREVELDKAKPPEGGWKAEKARRRKARKTRREDHASAMREARGLEKKPK